MNKISRRNFLGLAALGAGSAMLAGRDFTISGNSLSLPRRMPAGFQVWTIRESLVRDFPGTLKSMKDIGFETMEMCSPPGYESSGFGPLMKLKAREMKKIIRDEGLKCISSHYQMRELREHLDERIEFAAESGQTQMILASFGLPKSATLADWMKAAGELNKMGAVALKSGIQMGFHNHHTEFQQLEGKLIYDELLREFDPQYVKMQFQVAVINIGYKASDYFRKYPGRFVSAHLADWSEDKKSPVPVGSGIVDWNEFFSSIETGGVKNLFVEMAPDTFSESVKFLGGFSV